MGYPVKSHMATPMDTKPIIIVTIAVKLSGSSSCLILI